MAAIILGCVLMAAGQTPSEKPAMDLGGVVTVDYGAPVKELSRSGLRIGTVELSALVNIVEELTATVVIAAEDNLNQIYIDQAFASFTPGNGPVNLLFGHHYFNHGLLASRLISDPLITSEVEFAHPGFTATWTIGSFIPGAGFTVLFGDSATLARPLGLLNLDYALDAEGQSLVRLSGLVGPAFADADLGASIGLGRFNLDAELYARFTDWKRADRTGYFAGVAFAPIERFSLAIRHDGISPGLFNALEKRFAGGVKVDIKYGIYCAAEIAHVLPHEGTSFQEVHVQAGLEQRVKLPGFQRQTLTNER